jgi:DNA replication protein DnaC
MTATLAAPVDLAGGHGELQIAAGTLVPLLEHLGLPHAAAVLPAWLDRAATQELSFAEFLHGLLEEEATARANAATQKRLRRAGFPYAATIEQFDFRFRPELKRQVVLRYLDPTFVEQARTLTLIGAPGLGKTMLAICIATKQVQLGATARFVTAQRLAVQLGRAATTLGRQRVLQPLLRCDVLVLDELGYLPTEAPFGPAIYELIAGRYEARPTIITSNKSLTEWPTILQDASLASAVIDRLLHHGDVFYLKGPSWRLKGKTPPEGGSGEAAAAPQ